MIFVHWAIFNLISNLSSLNGQGSSSIGVLTTSAFPNSNEQNLPIDGIQEVIPDCGWVYLAAGNTSPGYYSVPNFGIYNVGKGNIGQANVGYNNIGFGNYGKDNIGRLNNGDGNIGYLNEGERNMGALNVGTFNVGDNNESNKSSSCMGYNNAECIGVIGAETNQTSYSIGLDLNGNYLIGNNSTGTGLIGQDNTGSNSIGFENENGLLNGNIGVQNDGDGLVGYDNYGTSEIGQSNSGNGIIGLDNEGNFLIGSNNTGTSNTPTIQETIIGFDNIGGYQDIGVQNEGSVITGFGQSIDNTIGGTYIDTSDVTLSEVIEFDPTDTVYIQNIGSNFNAPPSESRPSGVSDPFIVSLTAEYRFNLEFPAVLTVVDLGCPGDIIEVYDWSKHIMTTTIPQPASVYNCTGLIDGDLGLADPYFSRNFVTIAPGFHILTFALAPSSPGNGTVLGFRVDLIRPRPPCKECDAPVPPIDSFDSVSIDLPDEFRLYVEEEPCPVITKKEKLINNTNTNANNNTTNTNTNNHNNTNTTTTTTSSSTGSESSEGCNECEKVSIDWCKSKNFQMPREILTTHAETEKYCTEGLGKPRTPSAQLEITSLLLQCNLNKNKNKNDNDNDNNEKKSINNEMFFKGPWIGSDWNGNDYNGEFCLVANGEFVERAKDCNGKRRFICARSAY